MLICCCFVAFAWYKFYSSITLYEGPYIRLLYDIFWEDVVVLKKTVQVIYEKDHCRLWGLENTIFFTFILPKPSVS
jgi:hypothetical protein